MRHSFSTITLLLGLCSLIPATASAQIAPGFCETLDDVPPGTDAHDYFNRVFTVINGNEQEGDADHPYKRTWGLYAYTVDRYYGMNAYLLYPYYPDLGRSDDWLITRYVTLEKDKYYQVSLDASLWRDDDPRPQAFEVKYGMTPDAQGLRYDVIGRTEVTSNRYKHYTAWIKPRANARYHIGVHGVSDYHDNYYNYLFVDNVALSTARTGEEPAEISGLRIVNDRDGSTKVDIRFNAPSLSIAGNPLTAITKIEIYRDRKLIKTVENPAPGQAVSVSDDPGKEGDVEYRIKPFNAAGEGGESVILHRAGIGNPLPPKVISMAELENGAKASIKIEAPTHDVFGNKINPDRVTYSVYDLLSQDETPVATGLSGTELTVNTDININGQYLVAYGVEATINGKNSERTMTELAPMGKPYALPYRNSFSHDHNDAAMTTHDADAEVRWLTLNDHSNPTSQDGDNAFISMIGSKPDQRSEIRTGKISLDGAAAPVFSFYTYRYPYDSNTIDVKVLDMATMESKVIKRFDLSEYERTGWLPLQVDLAQYVGKTVRVGIDATIVTNAYVPIDNISLKSRSAVDLAVGEVSSEGSAVPGREFVVTAEISNRGTAPVSSYTVALMQGDTMADRVNGSAVAPDSKAVVELHATLPVGAADVTYYTVVINAEGDGDLSDNTSREIAVTTDVPTHPVISDLTLSGQDGNALLSWSEPDPATGAGDRLTEDFESYDDFASPFGNWTVYDGDQALVGGFSDGSGNIDMPYNDRPASFWIQPRNDDFYFIAPWSGTKVAMQMYSYTDDGAVPCDDWLISPRLYGGRQTVSLMARSMSEMYGREKFIFLYSTTGNDPDNFQILSTEEAVPDTWTRYDYVLPAGTRYFAVECVSDNCYALMLDDISFYPEGDPKDRTLTGYNVYRNGERLTAKPVSERSYNLESVSDGDRFFVTAVYDCGESAPSNTVTYGTGAVGGIDADDVPAQYYDLNGLRVDPTRSLPAGIYIERRGTTSRKILIR